VNAISKTFFPIDQLCLRSFLPRNQQIRVPDSKRRRRPRHELVALEVASHLVLTSFLFLTLAIGVWIATWAFHSLNWCIRFQANSSAFSTDWRLGSPTQTRGWSVSLCSTELGYTF